MVHRGSNHRVPYEERAVEKLTRGEKKHKKGVGAIESRNDDVMMAVSRDPQHNERCDAVEERDNAIKLSITECSTTSGDEREGPPSPHNEPLQNSNETDSATVVNKQQASTGKNKRSFLWTLARIVLLDAPLVFVFGSFMFLCWVHHVTDNYLLKQIEAATWTNDRDTTDQTYYYRHCDERDLTTTNPLDLYLPDDATPDDAYQHQLRHGFTVFPDVLSQETCSNLRNYIVSKNQNLKEEESIWLIEGNHRWSFSLGTEEPSVSNAVMELASNQRLKETMAKILGENPALIELTSITSGYGAKAQEFHHDGRTNLAQYGRGVAHAYSIFIQLQNTTKAGGATGACPGTHYCADGLEQVCEQFGVQPVNENGYWKAGDAMVMNMDGWHRGSAHAERDGPDRVMLCMTFTSRPRERAESRYLPQGISYSLRWDMWGNTWNDLITADTTMRQPWTTLRALGLYKKPSAEYGVDYVSSASQRIANEYFGFTKEDLETFVRLGGFQFLPQWLQSDPDKDTTWQEFLLETLHLCKNFMKSMSFYLAGAYIFLDFVVGLFFWGGIKGGARRLVSATFRLVIMYGAVFVLYTAATKHVENSPWASDLRNGLLYTSPFGSEVSEYDGPLTTPYRNDVLVETRYKSRYLAMYNDFIGNFPGNRLWNELVDEKASSFAAYYDLPSVFRESISEFIVSAVRDNSGRFLYQTWQSHWAEMSAEDSAKHTKLELSVKSNAILTDVVKELEFLISEAKYGPLRKTAMVEMDVFPSLLDFKDRLVGGCDKKPGAVATVRLGEVLSPVLKQFMVSPVLSMPQTATPLSPRPAVLRVGQLPDEPEPNAWLREGDIVHARYKEGRVSGFFKATLAHVLSSGICFVRLHVDEALREVECKSDISRYTPLHAGDRVDVKFDDGHFQQGMIVKQSGEGLYDINISGRLYESIGDDLFHRPALS